MRKLPPLVALLLLSAVFAPPARPAANDPHGSKDLLPKTCASCHVGHGLAGETMLPAAEEDLCFECHGDRARSLAQQGAGRLKPGAFPTELAPLFDKPSSHPVRLKGKHKPNESLYVGDDRHAECGDCHNHHRVDAYRKAGAGRKRSPLTAVAFESDLCYRCHGRTSGPSTDVSLELNPANRSFHPVEARTKGTGTGLVAPWDTSSLVACQDCHDNDDPQGPRGPHGSNYAPILAKRYDQTAGPESTSRYDLCYACHSRDKLLTSSLFPSHRQHVQQGNVACAECHNAHGSPLNRALIDFKPGRDLTPTKGGRLEFVSAAPGHGTCSMVCHGVDHDAKAY